MSKLKESNQQQLIDIMFEIALVLTKQSREFTIEYVRKQLKDNGYPTLPVGMSHGGLVSEEFINKMGVV